MSVDSICQHKKTKWTKGKTTPADFGCIEDKLFVEVNKSEKRNMNETPSVFISLHNDVRKKGLF